MKEFAAYVVKCLGHGVHGKYMIYFCGLRGNLLGDSVN